MGALDTIPAQLVQVQRAMLEKANADLANRTIPVTSKDEFVERLKRQDGFIQADWCGSRASEEQIKEATGATIRNIPYDKTKGSGVCVWTGKPATKTVLFAKTY